MTDDNIENLNEHRLRKAVDDLEKDEDILKFAQWVNENVTHEFTLTSDYGMNYDNTQAYEYPRKKKDHIREKIMTDDNVENLNEHRLRKAVDDLEKDEDILKFAQWVNENVTHEFTVTSDYGMNYDNTQAYEYTVKKKDHIREILMTMPDKNGYYTPPYS